MDLTPEIKIFTSRSSGKGGQHLNKTESKVELHFNINKSKILSDSQKIILYKRLKNKIHDNGEIIMISQESRSQLKNKEKVINRLHNLIESNIVPLKRRIKTLISYSQNEKRLKDKKEHSEKKKIRRDDY